MTINEDHYKRLADWAESTERELHPEKGQSGPASQAATRDLLRRASGRPSVDPDAQPGTPSPRRQVRLSRTLSDRVDNLAKRDNRSASDLMRQAIAEYVATRD